MTILEHALRNIDLEEIRKEANPTEPKIKIYWTLEHLDRLGRPIWYSKKQSHERAKTQPDT